LGNIIKTNFLSITIPWQSFSNLLNPNQMYKFILIVAVILLIAHIFYEPSILGIIALLLLIALSIWKIKRP